MLLISINNLYSKSTTFVSAPKILLSNSFNSSVIYLSQFASVCFLIYLSGTKFKYDFVTSKKYPNTLLNPTFKFLIPVSSFSFASNCISQFLPSVDAKRSSSTVSLYPFFIIFPSLIVIPTSSSILLLLSLLEIFIFHKSISTPLFIISSINTLLSNFIFSNKESSLIYFIYVLCILLNIDYFITSNI